MCAANVFPRSSGIAVFSRNLKDTLFTDICTQSRAHKNLHTQTQQKKNNKKYPKQFWVLLYFLIFQHFFALKNI